MAMSRIFSHMGFHFIGRVLSERTHALAKCGESKSERKSIRLGDGDGEALINTVSQAVPRLQAIETIDARSRNVVFGETFRL